MGSAHSDREAYDDEKPQHRVYVAAFYCAKYPVTNQQYAAFVRATGHRAPYYWQDGKFPPDKANHPVRALGWSDVAAFCKWAAGRCNTQEAGIGDTTPVDHYPGGKSPYGVYDMCGNVWEWTSTIHKPYPYRTDDGREDFSTDAWHVCRGGSRWSSRQWARAASRLRGPYSWDGVGGFRVGLAAPFSPL